MDDLDYFKEIASALRNIQYEMRRWRVACEKLVDIQEVALYSDKETIER
jgi:hypothetical protein